MRTDGLAWVVALISACLTGPASAQTLAAASIHGDLIAGAPAEVHVAYADAAGQPGRCDELTVIGGAAGPSTPVAPGVESILLVPEPTADTVIVSCGGSQAMLPLAQRARGPLRPPERIDGLAGETIDVLLTGPDLPPAEAIEVVTSEGRVEGVVADGEMRVITIVPDDSPYPRVVQIGLRDGRGTAEPVWSAIRLRARPWLPLQAEPGAMLSLEIGDRKYGPFTADASGQFDVRVDQFPGETAVLAHFVDDLGNELDTAIPLPTWTTPAMVGLVVGERGRVGPPPRLVLRVANADGRLIDEPPVCRSGGEMLDLTPFGAGTWGASLSANPEADPRVTCALGSRAATSVRIPLLDSVPARVRVRLWPDVVRTDAPATDVFVTVEDALGRLLPPDGLQVAARTGTVTAAGIEQLVWRGEWSGLAVEGRDVVDAAWSPVGRGAVPAALLLDWGLEADGAVRARARAVDRDGRPVPDVELVLDSGAAAAVVSSDGDGWARADLQLPAAGPFVLTARTRFLVARRVVQRGQQASPLPGVLTGKAEVRVEPGRVDAIMLRVEPAILRAGPAASAEVTAWVEDPSGTVVRDLPLEVTSGEGTFGLTRQTPQGHWVTRWTPAESEGERPVEIVARAGGLRTSSVVTVQPRAIRLSFGPWVGAQSNFGGLTRPVVGADVDVRTKAIGESVMFRVGVHGWSWSVAGGGTPATRVNGLVIPATVAALLRRDRGRFGIWAGGGAAAGMEQLRVTLGESPIASGYNFVAGPVILGGGGYRLSRSGELVLSLRMTWLTSGSGDVGTTGNVAGVAMGLGYRLVY